MKCVIFDLYGTLLELERDSMPFVTLARGAQCSFAEAIDQALTSINDSLHEYLIRVGFDDVDKIPQLESDLAKDLSSARLFPDTLATIRHLKSKHVRIGLISNLATPYKIPYFKLGLDGLIDEAIFSCDCGFTKPSVEIFDLALETLGVPRESATMVGESRRSDVNGAIASGINAVQICRGTNSMGPGTIRTLGELRDLAT